MSGFALVFDFQEPLTSQDEGYETLKETTIRYKQLNPIRHEVSGEKYVACKFDTALTSHPGVTVDEGTGSWLFAVGTALNSENGSSAGSLMPLLKDYLEHGNNVLNRLDGAFALVIYNRPANRLTIVSDPLGFFSIFFAERGSRVYLATSALAVAQVAGAKLSEQGAPQYLITGMVYGRSTLWQGVQRLPGGTVLEFGQTGCAESVYWSLAANEETSRLSLNDTVDHAINVLSRPIQAHIQREGTTWVDLTGGFDTRLAISLFSYNRARFRTICEGPSTSPDVRISSQIAQEMGWEYRHIMLPSGWGQELYRRLSQSLGRGDGHYDVFKLSRIIWDHEQKAAELNASVCGLGGELWRGFFWKQEFLNAGRSPTVDYDRLLDYRIMQPIDPRMFSDIRQISMVRDDLKSLLMSIGERYPDSLNTLKLDSIHAYKNMGHTGAHVSSTTGLQRVFTPFFLKETLSFAISTNYKWRSQNRMVRLIIEKLNPKLADYETTSGGPATPMRLTNIDRFIPYWTGIGKQLTRKISRSILGHSILPPVRDEFAGYSVYQWRQETLNLLEKDGVLDHAQMRSGYLYNPKQLEAFFIQARGIDFRQEAFLSRIITVELAMRAIEASL